MDKDAEHRMLGIYLKLRPLGIDEDPARKATSVLEYLYRRSEGIYKVPGEREMPSHCQRIGQMWEGMRKRNIPFVYGISEGLNWAVLRTPEQQYARELDDVSIGVEVGVHLGLINLCDGVKSGISAKGLEFVEG